MKKVLLVLGLSAIAMAGKCSSKESPSSSGTSEKASEEFPVKEDSQVPTEEVPAYENQEEAPGTTTPDAAPAPTETPVPGEGATPKTPGN